MLRLQHPKKLLEDIYIMYLIQKKKISFLWKQTLHSCRLSFMHSKKNVLKQNAEGIIKIVKYIYAAVIGIPQEFTKRCELCQLDNKYRTKRFCKFNNRWIHYYSAFPKLSAVFHNNYRPSVWFDNWIKPYTMLNRQTQQLFGSNE